MTTFDIIVIIAYLCAMLFLGWYVGRKNDSSEDYFAGSRSMPWYAIGFSVGATFISAGTFIGGPGWAYYDGIVAAMINFAVPLGILFATYVTLPLIYNRKVTTVYEYVNMRFGMKARVLSLVIWIFNSLIFIGSVVYIPCLVMQNFTGISIQVWIPIIVIMSIVYTIAGGIKAVIWSDLIQSCILICGMVVSVITCTSVLGMPVSEALQIGRDAGMMQSYNFSMDLEAMTMFSCGVAGFISWGNYFSFDQGQIQRYITAKNVRTIKKTNVLAIVAIQGIYWVAHILGVLLWVFYQSNPSTLDFANSNNIMIDFVMNYMPTGVRGIIVAAAFAAAMSTVDSILNATAAVIVKDIYEPFISKNTNTPIRTNMIISVLVGLTIIAFVYLYLGEESASILLAAANMAAPTGGLLAGIMICMFFIPKVNENSLLVGCVFSVPTVLLMTNFLPAFYLTTYMVGSLVVVIVGYICSVTVFKDPEAEERAREYTVQGSLASMKGLTDETGCSIEPLKFDKYAVMMIALFVIQCVILALLQ